VNAAATTYAIRVEGHLDDHWSAWLGGLEMTRDDDGSTTLTLQVADQAQLHGVLAGLRDIGAVITGLRTADAAVPSVLEDPLHTARLALRPATADDAEPTWSWRRLDVIVTLGHDDAAPVIGDLTVRAGVLHQARGAHAELSWAFHPGYSGQGYAAEAVRELLRYCFEELRLRRVTATCFLADDTSWKVMERLGMRRETHAVRAARHRSGRWLDTVGYAILDEEWSAAQGAS
jgi:hypothetical protein